MSGIYARLSTYHVGFEKSMRKILNHYKACLYKYATFKGRSGRAEYITFTLVNVVVSNALGYFKMSATIFGLVILIPAISVTARRLHDLNHTGWFSIAPFLIFLMAVIVAAAFPVSYKPVYLGMLYTGIGLMVLMDVWLCLFKGKPGANRYGENPLPTLSATD